MKLENESIAPVKLFSIAQYDMLEKRQDASNSTQMINFYLYITQYGAAIRIHQV